MRSTILAACVAVCAWAAPALADRDPSFEARIAQVEDRLSTPSSAREVQSAVDAYLATAAPAAALVGGPAPAGYDGGFWIRGGSFLLKINLTLQTRFEAFDWDSDADEPHPGGDLSGFSLPRVTLKLSGDATCDVHYYVELEFGHAISFFGPDIQVDAAHVRAGSQQSPGALFGGTSATREAWIEYEACPALAVRMGLLKTATTRQLMTPPELQQFVDISLASVFAGLIVPGYTDRNRDYGVMVHGVLGCDGAWSYLATITNDDGPVRRNVLDQFTNDNLAYSARVNWDVKGHMGYEEGALRQRECEWVASVGAWAYAYTSVAQDKPHTTLGDEVAWGLDAAAGYGSWSLTAAYTAVSFDIENGPTQDGSAWLVQVGFLVPDTAWEIAARYDSYSLDFPGNGEVGGTEFGGAVTYYIDGHSDKVTLDASFVQTDDLAQFLGDTYAGYHVAVQGDTVLLRLQWQLAL